MSIFKSRKILAATVAGLAVTGGVGAGIAASQDDSRTSSFFDAVAKHLGISSDELEDATRAAASDQVDAALQDGKITEEQAEELKSRIESGELPPFFGPGLFFDGPRGGEHEFGFGMGPGLGFHFGDKLSTATEYLGVTEDELREALRNGRSLADVAKAEGKSVDGLKEALLADAKTRLDEAVAEEKLTREQADRILERLREGIDNLVNANGENRMQFRFRGPGPGFGGGFGGPPGETPDNGAEPGDAAA
jgi:ribosomal protein S20